MFTLLKDIFSFYLILYVVYIYLVKNPEEFTK